MLGLLILNFIVLIHHLLIADRRLQLKLRTRIRIIKSSYMHMYVGMSPVPHSSPESSPESNTDGPTLFQGVGSLASSVSMGSHDSSKKRRTSINSQQLCTLLERFSKERYPTKQQKEQLSAETGLCIKVNKVWFQNRRSKDM